MKLNRKSCRWIALGLLGAMLTGCTGTPTETTVSTTPAATTAPEPDNNEPQAWKDDNVLRILTIGNSFSDDTMEYIYQIAQSAGVENVELGNLYIGGCTLNTHATHAQRDGAAYEYRTNTNGSWRTQRSTKMSTALTSKNWDFISLQQASGSSGVESTYSKLPELITYVKSLANPEAKLVWNMTWAYQQNSTHEEFPKYDKDQTTMYEKILNAVETQVKTQPDITMVSPTGTAIQNARTSYVGDTLTRDGYHLSMDLGRYIAGLTFFHQLTGVSIENVNFAPSGISESLQKIAIESAMNAVKSPTKVTNSQYTEEPGFDYSNYTKMELSWTPLGYWNSTDATLHHQVNTTAGNSKQFYASAQYTPDDIPVGSIIEVANGWQYRPEAWKSEGKQNSRPDNVSVKQIVVTEEWWGDYTHRAFNLSKSGTPSLENAADEIASALTIWIPKTHGYTKLEMSWTPLGYWNSTDASLHHQINTTAGNSKQFYASAQFTPEQIPVGSIIEVATGWQYRPEAWKSEGKQSGRPDNTSVAFVEVTAEWWGDYTHRAFNLSKLGLPSLDGAEGEIAGAFTIWIPKN